MHKEHQQSRNVDNFGSTISSFDNSNDLFDEGAKFQEALDYHQCMLILQRIQEFETISMCGQIFRYVSQLSKKFQELETTDLQDCCF